MTCIGTILDLLFSVSGVTIPGVFEYHHSPSYCVVISLTSQRTSPSSILIVRDFQFNPSLKPTAVPFPEEARGAGEVKCTCGNLLTRLSVNKSKYS